MIPREALDKVRDELAAKTANSDHPDYENGFDAAVSLLWPVIEAAEKFNTEPDKVFSNAMLIDEALSELKERVK